MRFIRLLSGQTGRSLFFRLTLGVDIGWDKSSWIDTGFSSYWFAHATPYSSRPEVLPPRWPLSVTRGPCSFIHLHMVPIHFQQAETGTLREREQRSRDMLLKGRITQQGFLTGAWMFSLHGHCSVGRKQLKYIIVISLWKKFYLNAERLAHLWDLTMSEWVIHKLKLFQRRDCLPSILLSSGQGFTICKHTIAVPKVP